MNESPAWNSAAEGGYTTSSTSTSTSTRRSIEPRSTFLDLPEDVRDLVCQLSITLSQRLEDIATTGSLKARSIIPIGREILDLSALCCVVRKMLAGLVPQSIPTEDELNQHIAVCERDQCCGCCSVLKMMDLDGDVMRSFPDDLDGSLLPISVQKAGIAAVILEVEKALAALDSLLYDDGTTTIIAPRRTKSLEGMVLQMSGGLRLLFRKVGGKGVLFRMKKRRMKRSLDDREEGERLGRRDAPVSYKQMRSMSACSVATG